MNPTSLDQLAAHLAAEKTTLEKFVSLLEIEQKELSHSRTEQLQEFSDKKMQLAQELAQLETQRKASLIAAGVSAPHEDWLRDLAPPELRQYWQSILKLAAQARDTNQVNGSLIQTQLRYNQQALSTLFKASNSIEGLYGPDGQTRINPGGRTLGSV